MKKSCMKKICLAVLFLVLAANVFAVSPTSKNVNKAKRHYATLERIAEKFDYDDLDDPTEELFFAFGRIVHLVESLSPVFEDFYDNGVEGIYLDDVEYLNSNYEDLSQVKPVLEMMLYNFEKFMISQLIDEDFFQNELNNLSYDEILNLPIEKIFDSFGFAKEILLGLKDDLPKRYENFSLEQLMNISVKEYFSAIFENDEVKAEFGFDLNDLKKWRSEYERGLAYDKIEFD